jgi:hypothetical protein
MKKIMLMAVILVAVLVPVQAGNERLVGSWKSNKAATLDYLKAHTKLTPQQLEKLGSILGSMVFTFDGENVTLKRGDWKFISKYKVIEESKNVIVIESVDPDTRKLVESRFEMETGRFWVADDKIPGYKERFDKLAKE